MRNGQAVWEVEIRGRRNGGREVVRSQLQVPRLSIAASGFILTAQFCVHPIGSTSRIVPSVNNRSRS